MPTLAEIRTQYPQYNDMSDDVLAGAIHKKFYSDIPRPEFDKKIGFQSQPQVGYVEDVAKSIPSGLARGVAGVVGLPELASRGIKTAEQYLRGESDTQYAARTAERERNDPYGKITLPSTEQAQTAIEGVTGKLYEPQTAPGKFANAAAEFVPGSLLLPAGGIARSVGLGVASGLASEGAGQAAEGTSMEAPARIAGALAAPLGVAGLRRAITPLPATAPRQAANAVMEAEGVNLTAGQRTGNMRLKYAEAESGAAATTAIERQKEQFTRAVLRRAGEDADRASPEVIDRAFTRLGNQFDGLAARNNVHGDAGTVRALTRVWGEYTGLVSPSMRSPIVENVLQDITNAFRNQAGVMDGAAYGVLRSRLETAARETADNQLRTALRGIRGALDDTMERSIARNNPADLGAYRDTRRQYRNLLPIAKAAEGAGELGLLTPEKMRQTTVSAHGGRNYARGEGDLAEVVRAGNDTMKALPQSGTSPRATAQILFAAPGAVAGYNQGGIEGGAVGAGAGVGIASLLGALGGRYAVGRGLMSRPVQGYLGNQLLGAPAAGSLEQLLTNVPRATIGNAERLRLLGDQPQ